MRTKMWTSILMHDVINWSAALPWSVLAVPPFLGSGYLYGATVVRRDDSDIESMSDGHPYYDQIRFYVLSLYNLYYSFLI
jgi:hypothetical protein